MHAKHKNNDHNHACGWDNNLTLWHADGSRLTVPWWLLITAFNIGLWWWQPLLLVLFGAVVVAWGLGYRIGKNKRKSHD